ncbi:uncharacterized protein PV07_08791 [Cladophialophora immunda]|uniref:Uncharacterized protein n=1 Tax=Cladophialophora immunda TaxID=569365 RepID=A0A0D2C585_9EURO|nr:uncharacterized protein PV07_08791 [Cladophialophora immunda]KIW25625.1 hypothetical protein PV07_08791 [Cladophialophora immunda]
MLVRQPAVAPILAIQGVRTKRMTYIGTSTTSTAFAAELKRIDLPFQIAAEVHSKTNTAGKCCVFTDNQGAIQAMADPKYSSGQYILADAIQAMDKLRDQGWGIQPQGIIHRHTSEWPIPKNQHEPNHLPLDDGAVQGREELFSIARNTDPTHRPSTLPRSVCR